MVTILNYYRGLFSIQCFMCSEGGAYGGGEEDEVAGRAGERSAREACEAFPLALDDI